MRDFLATRWGVVSVGLFIGVFASLLQFWGNPGNMGICVACFERDIAGSVGLHRAAVVQYMRPEIIGFVLGSFVAAYIFKEFRSRQGSSPLVRFLLGVFAMIGALIFLGCPWRALLRLAGGDWNAILGLIGLTVGIWIGTMFLKMGYNLGRTNKTHTTAGWIMPLIMLGFLLMLFFDPKVAGEAQGNLLFYSVEGPGSMYAPVFISLAVGLALGFLAQKSRFCTMGALRDLILFKQTHLFSGMVSLVVAAFITNMVIGQFNPGFLGQPVAHDMHFWNFAGMALGGLAYVLGGGCPGRQLFLAGEGDGDAGIFALGMIIGAAFAHNFGLASSPDGVTTYGIIALFIGFAVCLFIGFTMREKV
ncbi:MAG: YedE-related selenium metabolism membrane protein [Candidatus Syntrophonatronum acetioxidans]|uniref:YedE-related selenium metabolism membrane protein n=1 Tax=Candidatus Syntrophonatronum acetioxidans TaxID=1795816 RepID=A0A424YE26_9FIRM|nr:MAG: YedE-related selenium metabolism membrane protein [Candidatus Syntrophonatronum acetioxidans]